MAYSNQKGSLGFALILIFVVALFLFSIGIGIFGLHVKTSNGAHVGYITATESNGMIFKTKNAYIKTDTQSSQEDQYCVTDDVVYKQLQELSKQKSHVEVEYIQYISNGITTCDAGNLSIITKVIEVK